MLTNLITRIARCECSATDATSKCSLKFLCIFRHIAIQHIIVLGHITALLFHKASYVASARRRSCYVSYDAIVAMVAVASEKAEYTCTLKSSV